MSAPDNTRQANRIGFNLPEWYFGADWSAAIKECVTFEFDPETRTASLALSEEAVERAVKKIAIEVLEEFFSQHSSVNFHLGSDAKLMISSGEVRPIPQGRAAPDDYTGGGRWQADPFNFFIEDFDAVRRIAANATRIVAASDVKHEFPIIALDALLDDSRAQDIIDLMDERHPRSMGER